MTTSGDYMIEPKILKGFRDSLPTQEIARQNLMSSIQDTFRSFGFVPIDTPALEYTEVLLGKGGGETDKQMFRFTDNGGRDVALRFDLTVPLARYVSSNSASLSFPFKRYHMAKVWRGEKPQKGRYREFMQCDFDIIGADSAQSDFEILLLIHSCLKNIGVPSFRVHVSHRGLTGTFISTLSSPVAPDDVLRAIDKLGKIGTDGVKKILSELGMSAGDTESLMAFISLPSDNYSLTLDKLTSMFGPGCPEIVRLRQIKDMADACGITDSFVIDTSITRGLDYYTGIVWETFLEDMKAIGSVCSGGRYDNLTGLYSKDVLPGVGSCIGLDRLIAALEELGSPLVTGNRPSDVLIISDGDPLWSEKTALRLRECGLKAECYLGNKGKGAQFAYAESNGIPYVVCSEKDGLYSVKEISTRQIFEGLSARALAQRIK